MTFRGIAPEPSPGFYLQHRQTKVKYGEKAKMEIGKKKRKEITENLTVLRTTKAKGT